MNWSRTGSPTKIGMAVGDFRSCCGHLVSEILALDTDERSDPADVASILFWEWRPHKGFDDEIVEYYAREMGPLFCQASEVLRLRWFKIRNATVLKRDSYNTLKSEDLHTYMCLVEINCEDWPWGEIFAINELSGWAKYFEDQRRVVSSWLCRIWRQTLIKHRNGRPANMW